MRLSNQLENAVNEAVRRGAVWTEPGEKVAKFLRDVAKKYRIRLEGFSPKRVLSVGGGNEVGLQYFSSVRPLSAGWDEDLSSFRVQEILKRWGANTPEEVVRRSQKALDDDIERVRKEWEGVARKIESSYPPFKATVKAAKTAVGPVVNLEVRGRFAAWQ